MRNPAASFRFRTKLALAMLLIFFLTVALLFAVDTFNERRLIEKMENTMEAVTKAIEVATDQAQLSVTGPIDSDILQDYAEKLRQRGVREIQILNPERTVIATSKARTDSKTKGKRKETGDISITGTIGEKAETAGPLREYRLIMPIISQNQKVGYVTVDLLLDDYEAVISRNFGRRVAALSLVFGIGLIFLLLLTRNFTEPLHELSQAAGKIADGNLDAAVTSSRSDDLGALLTTWNAMVDRLQSQRALETRLAAAERRASLGHLASGIAHEIRNPLNTIGLAVDYLRRRFRPADADGREEFEKTAGSVRDEISRLNSLISNFLTYGKPLHLQARPMDAARLVRSASEELLAEAASRGVTIAVEGEESFTIEGDPNLLKSAFLNVGLNAIQVMPAGGVLSVRISSDESGFRAVFEDTGPGIAAEDLPKIFEPYFSRREAGVGLGLAMSRAIVTDHGGELRASNRPAGGSRFEFFLPRNAVPAAVTAG